MLENQPSLRRWKKVDRMAEDVDRPAPRGGLSEMGDVDMFRDGEEGGNRRDPKHPLSPPKPDEASSSSNVHPGGPERRVKPKAPRSPAPPGPPEMGFPLLCLHWYLVPQTQPTHL